jgi:hypothetical protein
MTLFLLPGVNLRVGRLELGIGFLKWTMQIKKGAGQHFSPDWDELPNQTGRLKKEIRRLGKQLEGVNPGFVITVNGKRKGIFSDFLFKNIDKVEEKELYDILRAATAFGSIGPERKGKALGSFLQTLSFLNRRESRAMTTSGYLARLILEIIQPLSIESLCDLCSGMGILGVQALSENPLLRSGNRRKELFPERDPFRPFGLSKRRVEVWRHLEKPAIERGRRSSPVRLRRSGPSREPIYR